MHIWSLAFWRPQGAVLWFFLGPLALSTPSCLGAGSEELMHHPNFDLMFLAYVMCVLLFIFGEDWGSGGLRWLSLIVLGVV
ncbi:hypothetical protein AMTR_s00067p00167040 [Amborella trichopoda]|uniref:Uncharacterized protein n=1 Tax=Amborella trichopoda TaxID=13333 RepID=U5D9J9_AMBTC|nr:hypothetical protein AMTR_s00067p00167040 [Amborella trichopoda]